MKEPNDVSVRTPAQAWNAYALPIVVTNHFGDVLFLSVSENSGDIELYSSQLVIPSSSASSQRSLGCNGFRVQSSSNKFHLANQISHPSGIPSSSVSVSNGSQDPELIFNCDESIEPAALSAKVA